MDNNIKDNAKDITYKPELTPDPEKRSISGLLAGCVGLIRPTNLPSLTFRKFGAH